MGRVLKSPPKVVGRKRNWHSHFIWQFLKFDFGGVVLFWGIYIVVLARATKANQDRRSRGNRLGRWCRFGAAQRRRQSPSTGRKRRRSSRPLRSSSSPLPARQSGISQVSFLGTWFTFLLDIAGLTIDSVCCCLFWILFSMDATCEELIGDRCVGFGEGCIW